MQSTSVSRPHLLEKWRTPPETQGPDDTDGLRDEGGAQRRERTRIVREIGVHLEDVLITPRQGVVEAGPIRRAQALFGSAVQHRHPRWEAVAERFRELASPVWRVVVDDQHVKCAQ